MLTITVNKAQDAFEMLFKQIMMRGELTKHDTKALYNVGILITNPEDNEIKTSWRKWNKGYAEREWQWYLSGDRSVAEIKKYAKIWDKMHGGDNLVNSNYGWQWYRNCQLEHVINMLKATPHTRQAWVTIYDGKEHEDYTYDTPCTIGVGFRITADNKLNMDVIMRSNDLVYGFCNDQYCFSNLQKMVADELGIKVGQYYHYATDMHIYSKHYNLDKR